MMTPRRGLALIATIIAAAWSCAKIAPPPGGPVDDTPPTLLASEPATGAVGVASRGQFALHFSEKMDKRSVEHRLRIFPQPEEMSFRWQQGTLAIAVNDSLSQLREVQTLLVETAGGGGEDVPTIVTISGFSEDRRGNKMGLPVVIAFTAADSLPTGVATGTVTGGKRPDDRTPPVTIRAYALWEELPWDDPASSLIAETEAGEKGEFTMPAIPTTMQSVILLAYQDDDANGEPDFETEFYGFSDTLRLTTDEPRADSLQIKMVNAESPATIAGSIGAGFPTDSMRVTLETPSDTLFFETTSPDSTGAWSFSGLPAGEYRIRLLRGDSGLVAGEEIDSSLQILADETIHLQPGERRGSYHLVDPPPAPPPDPLPEHLPEAVEKPQVTE